MINTFSTDSNDNKMLENLYKIVRMSLLVGKLDDNREAMINNLLEAALKLDFSAQKQYTQNLESKFYTTTTLEEEAKKLENLITFIGDRVKTRENLVKDFKEITGRDIEGLSPIDGVDELNEYTVRLQNIKEYLSSFEIISNTKNELEDLNKQLNAEKEKQEQNELNNVTLENNLVDIFKNCVKEDPNFRTIETLNVVDKLNEISKEVIANKESLEIAGIAYASFKDGTISDEMRMEYNSLIQNSKLIYFQSREKEILFSIYKLILNKETEYMQVFMKRDNIIKLLEERLTLRNELGITTIDVMAELYRTVKEQYVFINSQKENIENISRISDKIKFKEAKLDNLEANNNKPEVLELLREYNIPVEGEIEFNDDTKERESSITDDLSVLNIPITEPNRTNITNGTKMTFGDNVRKSNEITNLRDTSNSMNFNTISDKANRVMENVGKMLGVTPQPKKTESTIADLVEKVTEPIIASQTENLEANNPTKIVAFPTGLPATETSVTPNPLGVYEMPNATTQLVETMEMPTIPTVPVKQPIVNTEPVVNQDLIFPTFDNSGVNNQEVPLTLRKVA